MIGRDDRSGYGGCSAPSGFASGSAGFFRDASLSADLSLSAPTNTPCPVSVSIIIIAATTSLLPDQHLAARVCCQWTLIGPIFFRIDQLDARFATACGHESIFWILLDVGLSVFLTHSVEQFRRIDKYIRLLPMDGCNWVFRSNQSYVSVQLRPTNSALRIWRRNRISDETELVGCNEQMPTGRRTHVRRYCGQLTLQVHEFITI